MSGIDIPKVLAKVIIVKCVQLQPMSPALTPCVYYVSARGLDRISVMIRYILGTTWPYIKEDEMCGTVNNNVSLSTSKTNHKNH